MDRRSAVAVHFKAGQRCLKAFASRFTHCYSVWWHSDLLREAYICALDAEWEPNSSKAIATLVQLAFLRDEHEPEVLLLVSFRGLNDGFFPASDSSINIQLPEHAKHSAVQDLLALPEAASGKFLQELFRKRTLLKVSGSL